MKPATNSHKLKPVSTGATGRLGLEATLLQDEATEKCIIELRFRTRDGRRQKITIDAAQRSEPVKTARALAGMNAELPERIGEQVTLVTEALARLPRKPILLTGKPGFRGPDGFIMPHRSFGTAQKRYRWKGGGECGLGQSAGTLEGWNDTIGKVALQSPYLTFAILIALGACLPGYFLARGRGRLVSETALVHFSAESTTLKTSLTRAALSVSGHPGDLRDWDGSSRGMAEALNSSNNLLAAFDDTEKCPGDERTLRSAARELVQKVAAGRSKAITQRLHSELPPLTWSTYAISTGVETMHSILDFGSRKTSGDRVRALDVVLPGKNEGGIFGSEVRGESRGKRSIADLVALLETGLAEHYGCLFPRFVQGLIGEDVSDEICGVVRDFADEIGTVEDPLSRRIAEKLGPAVAAGELAISRRLLDWPEDWPRRAISHCCEGILQLLQTDKILIDDAVRTLAESARKKTLKFVDLKKTTPFSIPQDTIGVRAKYKDRSVLVLRREMLGRLVRPELANSLLQRLERTNALVRGHGGKRTVQIRRPLKVDGGLAEKPRLLVVDQRRVRSLAT